MTWLVLSLLLGSPDAGMGVVACTAEFTNGMKVRAWISASAVSCEGQYGAKVYAGKAEKDLCTIPSESGPPLSVSRAGLLTIPPMTPIPMECKSYVVTGPHHT